MNEVKKHLTKSRTAFRGGCDLMIFFDQLSTWSVNVTESHQMLSHRQKG